MLSEAILDKAPVDLISPFLSATVGVLDETGTGTLSIAAWEGWAQMHRIRERHVHGIDD